MFSTWNGKNHPKRMYRKRRNYSILKERKERKMGEKKKRKEEEIMRKSYRILFGLKVYSSGPFDFQDGLG